MSGRKKNKRSGASLNNTPNESQSIENASTNILHISNLDNSVTAHIIRRTVRWRGLSLPKDIRLVEQGEYTSAFLEFRSIAEAEAMIEEFNYRLFSQEDNIAFLNLSAKKARPEVKSSKINYIFLHWKSLRKNFVSVSTTSVDNQDKTFKSIPELLKYIKHLKATSTLVAVLESVHCLHKLNQICDNIDQLFSGWIDLNQLVMTKFDPSYLKYCCEDETRLPDLFYQTFKNSNPDKHQENDPQSSTMKQIFEAQTNPQNHIQITSLNPDLQHLVMTIDIGLVSLHQEGGSVIGSLAVRTENDGFSCGIDLSSFSEDSLDWDSAKMLGLHISTSGTWLIDNEPCLSERSCLDQLLQFMSNNLESCRSTSSRVGGIILTSILYEDSLVYLLAAMKRHGLLKQFENLVAGFSHIETVFKKKNICRKVFNLRYLDRFLQAAGVTTTQGLGNLETQSSQVLARVGYEALNHVMDGNICSDAFLQQYSYPFRSGLMNKLLEAAINKSELSIFDSEVCESKLHHSVTLLPGQTTCVTLLVIPSVASYTNTVLQFIPECLPQQQLYKVLTDSQRTNPSGMLIVKVLNQTKNKIRLPKGLFFGLLRLSNGPEEPPEPERTIIQMKTISNFPRVDLENIKIEPSESSDESIGEFSGIYSATTNESTEEKFDEFEATSDLTGDDPSQDLELIIASKASDFFATDILQELSDQLNPEPPTGWEDLNPTFSSLGITSALADVDIDLPIFEDIASGINDGDDINKPSAHLDLSIGLGFDKPDTSEDVSDNTPSDVHENKANDNLNTLKVSTKTGTVSKDKPLIWQLKVIKEQIKNYKVEGDLSIQFPSLIGEEEYLPLYKTLMQYTGIPLDDLPYHYVEFGEKVYSEILNFDLTNGLDELCDIMKELHDKALDANIENWADMLAQRFSSLQGIDELNGENFVVMLVQIILLHFCESFNTSEFLDMNIRFMYCFPNPTNSNEEDNSTENLLTDPILDSSVNVESMDESCKALENSLVVNEPINTDVNRFDVSSSLSQQESTIFADTGLPEQLLEAVALVEKSAPKLNNIEILDNNTCENMETNDIVVDNSSTAANDDIDVGKIPTDECENFSNNLPSSHDADNVCDNKILNMPTEEINDINNLPIEAIDSKDDEIEIIPIEPGSAFAIKFDNQILEISPSKGENNSELPLASDKTRELQTDPDVNNSQDISANKIKNKKYTENIVQNKTKVDEANKTKSDETSKVPDNILPEKKKNKVTKPTEQDSAPFDGDSNFNDLHLAIKMESSREQCSILVFVRDLPRNAVITGDILLINGVRQTNEVNVKETLDKADGGEGDTMLVLSSSLVGQDEARVKVAVPLAAWQDNKYFFRGFILFRENKNCYRGAFLRGSKLETVMVDVSRLKNFDGDLESPLEPGLQIFLMVKPREAAASRQPQFRASLCIPDPEKRSYDLLDITPWSTKTKSHFTDPETLQDIAENCGNGVKLDCVKEGPRTFLIIRGRDKKSCIDGFNKIIKARNLLEQLPGNRPKKDTALEIMMDSVPFTDICPRPVNLLSLQLTAHYTGTTLRIMEDELVIEGVDGELVELARQALTFNLIKTTKEQVQIGSVMSTSGPDVPEEGKPSKVTERNTKTSKEKVPKADAKNNKPSVSSSKSEKPGKSSQVSFKPLSPTVIQLDVDDDEVSSTTPEEIQTSKKRSSDDNNENIKDTDVVQSENSQVHNTEPQMEFDEASISTIDNEINEDEALRKIFHSEGPSSGKDYIAAPSGREPSTSAGQAPHRIPLKLGKSFELAPGATRSITLALKQKIVGRKYVIRTHTKFQPFQEKVEVVLELINGSNVQVDLENVSSTPVQLDANLYIAILVERVPKVKPKSQTAKNDIAGPGFVRKEQISRGGIKNPTPVKKLKKTENFSNASAFTPVVEPPKGPVKRYKVALLEDICIPGKTVSYARVHVVSPDYLVLDKVHEILRHPDFKNNDIFVPERQKKKISKTVKLHMSIKNRLGKPIYLTKSTIVGQIIVPLNPQEENSPPGNTSTSNPTIENADAAKEAVKRSSPTQLQADKKARPSSSENKDVKKNPKTINDNENEDEDNKGQDRKQKTKKSSPTLSQKSKKLKCSDKESSAGNSGSITPVSVLSTQEPIGKQELLNLIKNAFSESGLAKSVRKNDNPAPTETGIGEKQKEDCSPCSHDQLRSQACKNIMLGIECKETKCQETLQHKLPLDFVMLRNKEFCMDYLRKRVCAKSFPPFECKHEYHVYDAMEVVRFYNTYVEELKENCGWCQRQLSKNDNSEADKDIITLDTDSSPEKLKPSGKKSRSVTPELPKIINKNGDKSKSRDIESKDSNINSAKKTIEDKCNSNSVDKNTKEAIETVTLAEDSVEGDDEIQILDVPDITASPLKMTCAHSNLNSSLCPSFNKCKEKACPNSHTINPSLKISPCLAYLENGSCDKPLFCPDKHVNYEGLQELYSYELRKLVLNCNKCFFNCKLYNPKEKKHRQNRICYKDFTSYCRNKADCVYIHFEELVHLNLTPPCKIFAVREMCPKRSIEKDVVHMTHRNYQSMVFTKIQNKNGKCPTCLDDLKAFETELQQKIQLANETLKLKMIDNNEHANNNMPELELVSDEELSEVAIKSTKINDKNMEDLAPTEAGPRIAILASTSRPTKSISPLSRIRQDQSESLIPPPVVPSHSRLPPVITHCSRIQVKPKVTNPVVIPVETPQSLNDKHEDNDKSDLADTNNLEDIEVTEIKETKTSTVTTEESLKNPEKKEIENVTEDCIVNENDQPTKENENKPSSIIDKPEKLQDSSTLKPRELEINSAFEETATKESKSLSSESHSLGIPTEPEPGKTVELSESTAAQSSNSSESVLISLVSETKELAKSAISTAFSSLSRPSQKESPLLLNLPKPVPTTAPYHSTEGPSRKRPNFNGGGYFCGFNNPPPPKMARKVCQFYGTSLKCQNGWRCPNIHDLSFQMCKFFQAGYCQYGTKCKRKH